MRGEAEDIVHTDIVLVGGGHAHVEVLKSFGMAPPRGVRLTVVTREVETPYSGMLPGLIAGHYRFEDCHIDLAKLARFAGARLIMAEATGVDTQNRRVMLPDRAPLAFDLLSIDIEATPDFSSIEGVQDFAIPVKPIGKFLSRWEALKAAILQPDGPRRIVVIGAGAGGVELILAIRHTLLDEFIKRGAKRHGLHFVLLTDDFLPSYNAGVRRRLAVHLREAGISLFAGFHAVKISRNSVSSADGRMVAADAVLLVTQAAAPAWLKQTGLPLDGRGFLAVTETLQSPADPRIFAAGDSATQTGSPRPKAGVFSVRQGAVLAENLRRIVWRMPLKRYKPQSVFLSLISTGGKHAVASYGPFAFEGDWVWLWKNFIDRRWMSQYQDLPVMAAEPPAGLHASEKPEGAIAAAAIAMRCGGCGAKIGPTILSRVLDRVHKRVLVNNHIVVGLSDREDAAAFKVPDGTLVVQSADSFRAIVDDPWLFGAIAANHALNDLYAMNAVPIAALALASVPYGPAEKVEETLFQMLDGAAAQLAKDGVPLIGGHSSEGAELALGFSVTGSGGHNSLVRKRGLKTGDILILTRPIGTGVLFAGEMQGLADGRAIARALELMQRSNKMPAAILVKHGATAMTDISGFGLAGHLMECLQASNMAAELKVETVPVLQGALELSRQGVGSSLLPQNIMARADLPLNGTHPRERIALLFDPQTAGGLLAGVPAAEAPGCLAELWDAGEEAAMIGRVTSREDAAQPLIRLQ